MVGFVTIFDAFILIAPKMKPKKKKKRIVILVEVQRTRGNRNGQSCILSIHFGIVPTFLC